jgi:hypothetical protein
VEQEPHRLLRVAGWVHAEPVTVQHSVITVGLDVLGHGAPVNKVRHVSASHMTAEAWAVFAMAGSGTPASE